MKISTELTKSVEQAAKNSGQSESVARRLIAWLNELNKPGLTEENIQHLDVLLNSIEDSEMQ